MLTLLFLSACARDVGPFQPGPWGNDETTEDTAVPVFDGLLWADEFDGPAGTSPDPTKWTYDIGGHGWGNEQLEHNTDRTDNVRLSGDGVLEIVALEESYQSNAYTSGRIKTEGLFTFDYGRIEARIKVPAGSGLWPAFWMLGEDFSTVGWPDCGEIDILEARGSQPGVVHGTVHGPGYSGGSGIGSSAYGADFTADFHVYGLTKAPGRLIWDVDGVPYFELTPEFLPPESGGWAFDKNFFLILNLAVGGNFLEPPNASTPFPSMVEVDYVRVYGEQ